MTGVSRLAPAVLLLATAGLRRVLECLEIAGRDGPKLPEPVASAVAGK